jgi:DNA-binding XRE family transcriptional regulator
MKNNIFKLARINQGIEIAQLASLTGYSEETIKALELGVVSYDFSIEGKVGKHLNLSLGEVAMGIYQDKDCFDNKDNFEWRQQMKSLINEIHDEFYDLLSPDPTSPIDPLVPKDSGVVV